MPEGINLEVAHKLSEQEKTDRHKRRWEEIAEIVEVLFLAIAAIATAWSGYQAATGEGPSVGTARADDHRPVRRRRRRHPGRPATGRGLGHVQRLAAGQGGQQPPTPAGVRAPLHPRLPQYLAAWLKTEPFTNPAAPAGLGTWAQYRNPGLEQAKQLNAQAQASFAEGTAARETADSYVRATVLFALCCSWSRWANASRSAGCGSGPTRWRSGCSPTPSIASPPCRDCRSTIHESTPPRQADQRPTPRP
jgi:hypothetical protein